MAEANEEMIPAQTVELIGMIMEHNMNDLAHTNSILLSMAEKKAQFFAQALVALHKRVEAAIPEPLRPMAIENALGLSDWKVSEAINYIDPDGSLGLNSRGSM